MSSARGRIAASLQQAVAACQDLRAKIMEVRQRTDEQILTKTAGAVTIATHEPKQQHLCTGHFGKIYALHWGIDSNFIVTASQDGKLIVWNAKTGTKQLAITLNSAWVMTCAFSTSYEFVASGGLDNTVSVFKVKGSDGAASAGASMFRSKELYRELERHDGYLSCARFIDDGTILSASGDGTCILWDIENKTAKEVFMDHTGDVMSIALNKANGTFVSGSVDMTAKVWDPRAGVKAIANFPGHEADVNTVAWFPDNEAFVTGSDDGTVRLYDMRSYRQLNLYLNPQNQSLHSQDPAGVTSADVAASGRYIFSAYDNSHLYMWSTLEANWMRDLAHENRVSSVGVSPNGHALATACWDFNLRVFV